MSMVGNEIFLWSYLCWLPTEETNADMHGKRTEGRREGEMMTSFVALKLGLQIPQLDDANLSTSSLFFFSISHFHLGFVQLQQKAS